MSVIFSEFNVVFICLLLLQKNSNTLCGKVTCDVLLIGMLLL